MDISEQIKLKEKAFAFAKEKHAKQKRKNGKPYFEGHLVPVANIVASDFYQLIPHSARLNWGKVYDLVVAAAVLHDVLEDFEYTGVTREDLASEFPVLVVELVEALTRRNNETYFDFIMRINGSDAIAVGARAIKLADLQHNMSDLNEGSLKDKYRFAEYILTPRN